MMNFFTKNMNKETGGRGFTILFAVLVSVLVLAVGASIITLSLKQILLSGSNRDSQFAFYASNTGAECAFYWDTVGSPAGGEVFATSNESSPDHVDVRCLGEDLIIDTPSPGGDSATSTFEINFEPDLPYNALVEVVKYDDGGTIRTTINSYGYNAPAGNPRRIERGLQFNY
jgi:hypothetical protein